MAEQAPPSSPGYQGLLPRDWAVPPGLNPDGSEVEASQVRSPQRPASGSRPPAQWTGEGLVQVARYLQRVGSRTLAALPRDRLVDAWCETVEAFLDSSSPERQVLEPVLPACCRLSPPGLDAALQAVCGSLNRPGAVQVFSQSPASESPPQPGVTLVILASNLPALALQLLLPALALGRPLILKSPTAEPFLAAEFLRALARREPGLAQAMAAVTWPGGNRALEDPLLAAVDRVVVYGQARTLADLEARVADRLFGFGPKVSLAVVESAAHDAALRATTRGLARDIALFDQRGCLSIQAIYTQDHAHRLAEILAESLAEEARRLPPGPLDTAAAAAVQQIRAEAELRGLPVFSLALRQGTVVVDPAVDFRPSPGLRCVRVHPVTDLAGLPGILEPWTGQLQGAALAGPGALALQDGLRRLGFSRFAPPGELQAPDPGWHNGGVDPRRVLLG